jgi:hypothetical protein
MKKFTTLMFGALLVLSAQLTSWAALQVASIPAATTNSLQTVPIQLQSVAIANGTTNTLTIAFIDAPSTILTNTTSAYTNWVSYTTNIVLTFTNINGVVESRTNTALFSSPNPVSALTNNYRMLNLTVVPASSTVTWQPSGGAYCSYGLLVTNSAAATVTLNYTTLLQ